MAAAGAQSWQAVQREVLRRIEAREWRPGALIPGEVDLAREFGCARATVNRALRELAEAGVLERKRKAGTRVALHPVRMARFEIPIIRHDIAARGADYGYRLLECATRPLPAATAAALGLEAGQQLLHVRALHFADGAPFVLEDRWINVAAVPEITEVDLGEISANEWLVENVAFSKGDLAFSARGAEPEDARLLQAPAGAALFVTERTTCRGAQPITAVRLLYAPGYRLHTEL